jgi:predicted unusual protein kinase regulating ubiquinone biosynthesis (AarF/ABC1/UbiB family)
MKRFLKPVVVFAIVAFSLSFAGAEPATASDPLYLSFEQRVLLSYALLAQGQPEVKKEEIVQRLNELKKKNLAKGPQVIQVRNFDEFLKSYRGDWPGTNSLDKDLTLIENAQPRGLITYKSPSPRIQQKIDAYIQTQTAALYQMGQQNKNKVSSYQSEISAGLMAFAATPGLLQSEQAQLAMEKRLLTISDSLVSEQIQELDHIGEKIAQSDFGAGSDPSMKIVLETMMSEYFSRLSPESKKQIVSAFLGGDLKANDIEKFEVMVQNSGPQMQKTLQVIARQGDLAPEMLAIFRELESSVKSVPWVQVQEILAHEKGNYHFTYFERKPLGVGTMAQVHRAKILVNGQRKDVVVRFIKPDIEKRVMEDHKILVEVAKILDDNPEFKKTGMPKLGPLVDDITKTVTAELDQNATVQRQLTAKKAYEKELPFKTDAYKGTLKIHVPDIYPAPGPSQLMVQEMVIGSKLDKEAQTYQETIPELKKTVIEQMAQVWLQEVLFGTGFYHSDLHQGNFMVRVGEPSIQLNILDYGMGGTLSPQLQAQVLVLGAGTELLNAKLISQAFWQISDKNKNTLSEQQFRSLVAAKVQKVSSGQESLQGIDRWAAWAMDQGIGLPYEFVNLNRGLVIVSKLLEDSGSRETMTSLTRKLALKNPLKSYRIMVDYGKLSTLELMKLGWTQLRSGSASATPAAPTTPPTAAAGALRCEAVFN